MVLCRQTLLRRGRMALVVAFVVLLGLIGLGAGASWYVLRDPGPPPPPVPPVIDAAHLPEKIHQFCGACHAYPPAETFPRSAWKEEVERGYFFFGKAGLGLRPPPIDDVVRYYE